jgi:hypothetical protein
VTALRDALARKDISKTDKYLVIVAYHDGPVKNAQIKLIAKENGWKDGAASRPELFLSKSSHTILLPDGWTMSGPGSESLEDRKLISKIGVLTPITEMLERYLLDLHDPDKSRFIEEVIICARSKSYRAAIVLSWVGAMFLLYAHVIANALSAFNAEMQRRFPKAKPVSTIDDLANAVKEGEFLNILEHIKVITKGENKELTSCLDRRNTAGHPNSHTFTEVAAGSHIETLINSVYLKF